MVAEAQAVRERVLRDLAVRRKKARQQVEKLNAGRERLLEAYDVVKRTVTEATDELTTSLSDARLAADAAGRRIDEEPEPTLEQLDEEVANAGLVDLPIAEVDLHDEDLPGPFSGEVPVVSESETEAEADAEADPAVSQAPVAPTELEERRGRKRRRKGFSGLPSGELAVVQPQGEDEGVRILAEPAAPESETTETEVSGAATGDVEGGGAEPADAASPDGEADGPEAGPVVEAVAPEPPEDAVPAATEDAGEEAEEESPGTAAEEPASPADTVFARLRAETSDADDADDADAGDAPEEPSPGAQPAAEGAEVADAPSPAADSARRPFAARAAALASVEKDLGRRLKRMLADEQNEVLDLLRRAKPAGVDDLLPGPDEHSARWADVVSVPLAEAAVAGADWSGGTASSVADLADELARGLTLPLRERIERSFSASDGNLDDVADRVRALYREWKGQRLSESAAHFSAAAYARGVLDGAAPGAMVRWVLDPDAGPCPDCDDNVLAGAVLKGTDFPTGSASAPAHPGCHCLVLAADA